MSKAKTRRIEASVKSAYERKGTSPGKARYIAGAVMGNIKRERVGKKKGR